MARRRHRQHTREFKLAAVARMGAAADVQALAQELDIERSLLYGWRRLYIRGGCGGTAEQWPAAGGADASVRSQRGV